MNAAFNNAIMDMEGTVCRERAAVGELAHAFRITGNTVVAEQLDEVADNLTKALEPMMEAYLEELAK